LIGSGVCLLFVTCRVGQPTGQLVDQLASRLASRLADQCTPPNSSEKDLGKKVLGLFLILTSNNHMSKKNL
jgi:hypothetical protein